MSRFEQTSTVPMSYDAYGKTAAKRGSVMSFGIYIIGFLILIGGLVYGAVLIHMAPHWIVVGSIVLLGLGILTGVKNTRQKDSAD